MGLLWGRKQKKNTEDESRRASKQDEEAAVKVPDEGSASSTFAAETSVFEFGTAGNEKLTLAGYCPVSDSLEPCRWELLPSGTEAPKFRIVF